MSFHSMVSASNQPPRNSAVLMRTAGSSIRAQKAPSSQGRSALPACASTKPFSTGYTRPFSGTSAMKFIELK